MKKLIWLFVLIALFVSFTSLAAHSEDTALEIKGVDGKVLKNVKKRLEELQQIKPLFEVTEKELINQVRNAVEPFGYFKAQINVQIISKQKILIHILPEKQAYIKALKVELEGEGAQNPKLLNTLKQLELDEGDPFFIEAYNKVKQNLLNTAEHLGYLHASFKKAEVLVQENLDAVSITLLFDTGPLYYFGQVQFDPTHINPELLHRYIPFKSGQAYSTEQILTFNNHLSESGYFSSLMVKPEIEDNATKVPILVHLQPISKYTYTLGAGYGTDTGLRGRAGLNIIPVNRYGHKFQALAQGSFTQNALQAQYTIPGKDPIRDQYLITGNLSNLNYDTGYSNAVLLSLAQQHQARLFKRVLSVNSLYESFRYALQPNTSELMLYPKATFLFDKTSNVLFSPSGYNVSLNALGSSRFTMSHVSFFQTFLDAKAAYMIEPWRLRLYGHTIQGVTATSDVNELPLSLALLLGGADNLKAFSFNSIGPGKIITYTGLELQKQVKKNWYLLGFMDSGAIYNPLPKTMQYDAGGGLMWVSPIGPIKVGVAQAINNQLQRVGGSSPRLVISMGPDL